MCYTTVYRGINSLTLTYTTRDSCITYNKPVDGSLCGIVISPFLIFADQVLCHNYTTLNCRVFYNSLIVVSSYVLGEYSTFNKFLADDSFQTTTTSLSPSNSHFSKDLRLA